MSKFGIVSKPKQLLTVEDLKTAFPAKKETITEEVVDLINQAQSDPSFSGDEFMKTMITYQDVMTKCSASMKEYMNAVKFCAYLESEDYNITEAYKRARANDEFVMARLTASTESSAYRELTSAASRYHKSPLVRQILIQSDMPLYLMFQGARYRAVSVLADEMVNAAYSKDRISAAEKLLTHVKAPENVSIELAVGPNAEAKSMQQSLNEQLALLAMNQKKMLEAGFSIKDAQKVSISVNKMAEDSDVLEAQYE